MMHQNKYASAGRHSLNAECLSLNASSSGFTLVEMAVVLVIMGLVIMTVFPALMSVNAANQRSLTQSNLHSLMLATAAYVQANGCLPCPADAGSYGSAFGTTDSGSACGTCSNPEGIPPFASLGVPYSTAHDGWGHWITMRVDPKLATNLGTLTTTTGLCQAGLSTASGAQPVTITIPAGATQTVAVVFVSHGSTGYGSFIDQPKYSTANGTRLAFTSSYSACNGTCSATGTTATIGYAKCNATGLTATTELSCFIDTPIIISNTNSYDDILAYANRNTLVSMLGNPGCSTKW